MSVPTTSILYHQPAHGLRYTKNMPVLRFLPLLLVLASDAVGMPKDCEEILPKFSRSRIIHNRSKVVDPTVISFWSDPTLDKVRVTHMIGDKEVTFEYLRRPMEKSFTGSNKNIPTEPPTFFLTPSSWLRKWSPSFPAASESFTLSRHLCSKLKRPATDCTGTLGRGRPNERTSAE
jgi:hypothetical protein